MVTRYLLAATVGLTFIFNDARAVPNPSSFADAAPAEGRVLPQLTCAALSRVQAVAHAVTTTVTTDMPGLCIVRGRIDPAIDYVVYLPEAWNGRFYMHGNGGDAGEALDAPDLAAARLRAARLGYAAAFTNTGHDAAAEPGSTWAYNQPQKEIDYGHRAVHETALAAKALINAYYGAPVVRAYFDGCSTGGRQGLMAAQRYPEDFDGILAGAPVLDITHMLWQYWKNQRAIERTPLSRARLALLGQVIIERFDAADGVRDGVIEDPLAIDFDPRRDLPRAAQDAKGFTDAEIETLAAIYGPVLSGEREIFPRTVIGGERPGLTYADSNLAPAPDASAWESRVVPTASGANGQRAVLESWFRYLLFDEDDPKRDWRTLAPERDLARMARAAEIMDATNPDLSAFAARGGKLILYHGWNDFGVNPLRTIAYADAVRARSVDGAATLLRLYLVPGMFHCWGGSNVDRFDLMTPLIDWVERGTEPGVRVGARVVEDKTVRTRLLCPHPQVARYRGEGSTDDHRNFICETPVRSSPTAVP